MRVRRGIAIGAVVLALTSSAMGAARSDEKPAAKPAQETTSSPTGTAKDAAKPVTQPRSGSTASSTPTDAVPSSGDGTLNPVLVPGADSTVTGKKVTYALEYEGGLGIDGPSVAREVGTILRDRRGWQTQDKVQFVQVSPDERASGTKPQIVISLVSPDLTDKMCAPLDTGSVWSCANKDHAVLNYRRWAEATPTYPKDLTSYRQYQVNHEVGHELGHPHATCPGAGKPAPVMLQQSMGLGGCVRNAWPTVTRG